MAKYRYEIKYIINKDMAEVLKQRLSLVMDKDINGASDGKYLIRSLYFDDMEKTAYYEKVDGVEFRKKYRIRIYNKDKKFIRLECKYKCNNMTYKKQQLISYDICSKIINGDIIDIDMEKISGTLLEQFLLDYRIKHLIPSVIVDYDRLAYTYHISDIRVTFDSKVKSGLYNYNLFDKDSSLTPIISDDEVILEVKFNEVLPEHIQTVLSTVPLTRRAFSKFASCASIK